MGDIFSEEVTYEMGITFSGKEGGRGWGALGILIEVQSCKKKARIMKCQPSETDIMMVKYK